MSLLPKIISSIPKGLLSRPGDKLSAEITPTGKQVVKLLTSETHRTAVRYPETGTIVETIVHKVVKK